jgi:AFG3 family protein
MRTWRERRTEEQQRGEQREAHKNGGKKGPKKSFNFYWIYGIIILVILSINLFQYGGGMAKIQTPPSTRRCWMPVMWTSIVVVNDQVVKVFIKKDRLGSSPHKEQDQGIADIGSEHRDRTTPSTWATSNVLRDRIVQEAEKQRRALRIRVQDNWGREILYWVLFFGVMIAIWMFVMRRIGGGGGPGGQIFNIGKSRAQVFEGGKSTNVTFNDVAGLDEAKEELQEIVDFLKTRRSTPTWAPRSRKVLCSWALRVRVRPCWPRPSPARPTCPSSA